MIRLSFKTLSLGLAALACLLAAPTFADPITYEMVAVGNPGNAGDTRVGSRTFGYGAVAYSYQIGKYDVTIGQYAAFLNAAAATDTYSLYNPSMGSDGNIKGISQNGSSGSYTYHVIGSADRPITYVSWFDAARYANWMTNGQGSGSTEAGAYTLGGATTGNAVAVNPGAAFYIPTEHEWYKAAFYSPVKGGVGSPGYYAYATQSDTDPGNTIGSGMNQVNYFAGDYSVTQSSNRDSNQNYLTDVGVFTGSGSFYDTFDQSGNVFQWTDLDGLASSGSVRGLRGGNWASSFPMNVSSSNFVEYDPSSEYRSIGFRLAAPVVVPEPSTYAMALAGLACGGWQMWRRRRLRHTSKG